MPDGERSEVDEPRNRRVGDQRRPPAVEQARPGASGSRDVDDEAAMRARFDGNTVASRHAPSDAEEVRARRRASSGRAPSGRTRQHAERSTSIAQPVGSGVGGAERRPGSTPAGEAVPPDRGRCRGTAGTRRLPGRPVSISVRLADHERRRRRRTRRRRCRTSSPASAARWCRRRCRSRCPGMRRYDVSRALPRSCRPSTSCVRRPCRSGGSSRAGRRASACAGSGRPAPAARPTPRRSDP